MKIYWKKLETLLINKKEILFKNINLLKNLIKK